MDTNINHNKIMMQGIDRTFRAIYHFVIYNEQTYRSRGPKELIAASFIGTPEASSAIAAGTLEGRGVQINGMEFYRGTEKFHKIERKVGMGDLLHSLIFNSTATITGIINPENKEDTSCGYIIAPDGNLHDAVADHLITRYGLPIEWKKQYYGLFQFALQHLSVKVNPDLNIWPNIKAAYLKISEEEVIKKIDSALKHKMLFIPPSEVQGVFDPNWTMKEYMLANSESMAKKLSNLEPQHVLEEGLNPVLATMSRTPFPAQGHMIQALVNTMKSTLNTVICSGDMGTGKSIIALGVCHVLHEERKANGAKRGTAILLSAPALTLSKWEKQEINKTLPHAKVEIIRTHQQALQLYKRVRNGYHIPPGELRFFLIGIDKSKMNYHPHYGGIWKRIRGEKGESPEYGWHCPDCGEVQKKKEGGTWMNLQWHDIAMGVPPTHEEITTARMQKLLNVNGLPKEYPLKWKKSKKYNKCCHRLKECQEIEVFRTINKEEVSLGFLNCGAKMYRGAVRSRKETIYNPTFQICKIFKRIRNFFEVYIADEVHKSKGATGRGAAFADMVKAAKRNLNLTGTLVNGKSSSIKEILWRTDPKPMIDRGFDFKTGDIQWAEKYGKLKQIVYYDESEDGVATRIKKKPQEPVETHGIAPHMTAEFLLHKSGFLELGDMGLPLVELKEIPIFVDMDPEHADRYSRFHEELYDLCARASALGAKGVWSKFIPSTIMYADRPDLGAHVKIGENETGAPIIKGFHPKQLELVKIVKKELAENRGCVIYNSYTLKYGMNEKTKEVLAAHGIRSVILQGDTDKRAEILEELAEKGEKVIITNMKMVEVGLDLLYWPTIINNQLTYETSVFRQSNRRNWRIGQNKECRCYILVYNGTQQMKQFMQLMSGRGHALMTEGRLDRSELAKFSRDEQSSLAADLANCFANSEIADAWTALAAKDLADVELIAEADFEEAVSARRKLLTNETRKLCGLSPIIDLVEKEIDIWGTPVEWEPFAFEEEQMDLFQLPESKPVEKQEEFVLVSNKGPSLFRPPVKKVSLFQMKPRESIKEPIKMF